MRERLLICERWYFYTLLIFIGGTFGAYTFCLKGGVFCNAQTANMVLFAIALGEGAWKRALSLAFSIMGYLVGTIVSESSYRCGIIHTRHFRYETLHLAMEAIALICLGLLPHSTPVTVYQITINIIAAMQFTLFRQGEHLPMATTFCTAHLRQVGINFVKTIHHDEGNPGRKLKLHLAMLIAFILGATIGTLLSFSLGERMIYIIAFFVSLAFLISLLADLTVDKDMINTPASGHQG